MSTLNVCAGCQRSLPKREFLRCAVCKATYDIDCANVSQTFFGVMTKKDQWSCPECKSKRPKVGNVNTPIRSMTTIDEKSKLTDEQNVTLRKRASTHPVKPLAASAQRSPPTPDTPAMLAIPAGSAELVAELRLLREEMKAARTEMQEFRRTISNLTCAVELCNQRIDQLTVRVEAVEQSKHEGKNVTDDVSKLEDTILELKLGLNDRDQELLCNDVEIAGVPEEKNEQSVHLALTIAQKLGVALDERDVISVERVGGPRRSGDGEAAARPRPLVLRLARRALRERLLAAARVRRDATSQGLGLTAEPRRIYVNERLTAANRQLFYKAREQSSRAQWRYVWTRDGNIFARKEHGSPRHRLRSESDLNKIFGPC